MLAAFGAWALSKAGATTLAILLVLGLVLGFGLRLKFTEDALRTLRARDAAEAAETHVRAAAGQQAGKAAQARVAQAKVRVVTVTRTLIEKVPTYVPPAADVACVVPVGFVRLHDAAAAGVPAPAGGPDETASGVPLSAVAATVIANYGAAYDWREEALGWRAWYVTQAAIWNAPSDPKKERTP